MKISQQLKNFIQKYSEQINDNKWEEIYSNQDWRNLPFRDNKKFTEIIYKAELDPLKHMTFIPPYFFAKQNIRSINIPFTILVIKDGAIYGCESLTDIYFDGTKQEWQDIEKGLDWNTYTGNYTIHCLNGDIKKNADNN